jgi:hypothetical protein
MNSSREQGLAMLKEWKEGRLPISLPVSLKVEFSSRDVAITGFGSIKSVSETELLFECGAAVVRLPIGRARLELLEADDVGPFKLFGDVKGRALRAVSISIGSETDDSCVRCLLTELETFTDSSA